jgi:hypothetical protein
MFGLIIGSVIAQFAGAWAYHASKKRLAFNEIPGALAGGLTTTAAASVLYILFHVHDWVAGPGASWGSSVFLGLCMGILQGVLFRGRPLGRRLTSA